MTRAFSHFCTRNFGVPLIILLAISSLMSDSAQGQSGRVYKDKVTPHWSEDGDRFWYRNDLANRQREFVVVDAVSGIRKPAFDHQLAAKFLSDELQVKISDKQLPITSLDWDSSGQLLLTASNKTWRIEERNGKTAFVALDAVASQTMRLSTKRQRSGTSQDELVIRIQNDSDVALKMYWISSSGQPREYQTVAPGQSVTQHSFVGHAWQLKSVSQTNQQAVATDLGYFTIQATDDVIVIQQADVDRLQQEQNARATGRSRTERQSRTQRRSRPSSGQTSPDGKHAVFVKDHNLWISDPSAKETAQPLTTNGSALNTYRKDASRARLLQMNYHRQDYSDDTADVRWSNDSKWLLAIQTTVVPERVVTYINSAPKDQLQPIVESYPYAKPGDEIPTPTFHLFNSQTGDEVEIDPQLFSDPWQLQFLKFADDGSRFWLKYNERGHRAVRLVEVETESGKATTVVENGADTFVHYSDAGKSVMEWLPGGQLLWASERSGWNHLYRIDVDRKQVINPVTSGEWNVKRIESIDRKNELIWFFAVGLAAGQDPYHEHFCRVNFDGTGFVQLTQGDGTHDVTMSPDRRFFVDRFSRVDLASVTELRRCSDGVKLCDLEQGDASEVMAVRRLPERFSAKGRDGETDIYGLIHFPKNFDPTKSYPVVENIYAGPHDHHVPKAFRSSYRHQHQIADRGMIVVQIDGMGTAWRSKAFHDVCYRNLKDAGFPDRILWMKAASKDRPWMDLDRVGIYGGSAGGQNSMAALIWHSDFYKVAVSDCGCHDNRMDKIWWNEQWMGVPETDVYERNSNTVNAGQLQGKLMLVVGEMDRNVDPATTTQVVKSLISADKDFVYLPIIGAGHGACETKYGAKRRADFLAVNLGAVQNSN